MYVLKLTLPMQLLLMSTPFNVTWIQQSPECDIKRVWLYVDRSQLVTTKPNRQPTASTVGVTKASFDLSFTCSVNWKL